MPAYLIASVVGVKDMDALRAYLEAAPALHAGHGGRYLARGGTIEVLDGDFAPKRVTIVEFPSMDDARPWETGIGSDRPAPTLEGNPSRCLSRAGVASQPP